MNTDREIDEILAEIGREHREVGAPHKLESVLRRAASSRKDAVGGPGLHAAIKWAVAVVLLAVVAAAGVRWHGRRSDASRDQPVRSVPEPEVKADPPAERVLAPSRPAARPARAHKKNAGVGDPVQTANWNSLDEFVALPVSEGLPPAAQMSVVRMKLHGGDLQQYGLQAPADAVGRTLLAEFVVGEDGLPRAIRIVR